MNAVAYGMRMLRADRVLSLQQATERHAGVRTAMEAALEYSERDGAGAAARVECTNAFDEGWRALVGTLPEEGARGTIAAAIELTIPPAAIRLMRRSDSTPAAYAFGAIASELIRVADWNDDLQVRDAVRRGWLQFDLRRRQANTVEEGFGCDESASWHTLRDLTEQRDPELEALMLRVAELAGRMFTAMSYSKRRVESTDPQEVRSAAIGGDVERLLPEELAKLGCDVTREHTVMRVLQRRAGVFAMRGERTKSRGPLVIALDESGSMHDGRGVGGRNAWAKAAAVALIRIAWAENRVARVVHFGNSTVTQDVPRDDVAALWEMVRSFLSGGTSFSAALSTARAEVGDLEKAGFKGADVVLVTDGEEPRYQLHTVEINAMDAAGIDLWTVSIGNQMSADAPVRSRAKLYVHARDVDLGNDAQAAALAAELKASALNTRAN